MLATTASAGFLVEPYLGYRVGDLESTPNGSIAYDTSGHSIGARLGGTFTMFMAGIDYSMGSLSADQTKGGSTDVDLDTTQLGIFAGIELPVLLRAWATYYVSANFENSSNSNEWKGDGIGLGVGFTGLPFVSLNLEYKKMSYDEAPTGRSGYDGSEIQFGVSLPLNL